MKNFLIISIMLFVFSCTSHKNEEVIIKEMNKATEVLSRQNLAQFHRIERLYKSDSTNEVIKGLYKELSSIREFKESYKSSILKNPTPDLIQENKLFLDKALAELDQDEQKTILQKFKDSPLVNEEAFSALDQDETLPYTLALEAELVTQEMFLIVLKDFKKKKADFEWEIYW